MRTSFTQAKLTTSTSSQCQFYHPPAICEIFQNEGMCISKGCFFRHPKNCRYWCRREGGCTRGNSCQYLHPEDKKYKVCVLGKKINLHGGGLSERSFIYIEDVCDAIYKIVRKGNIGETYHISTNKIVSIRELVKKICAMTSTRFNDLVKIYYYVKKYL